MLQEFKDKFKQLVSVPTPQQPRRNRLKFFLIVLGSVVLSGLLLSGVLFAYVKIYEGRVYPGVYAGPIPLEGMNGEEVKNFAETFNNRLSKEGLDFVVKTNDGGEKKIVISSMLSGDNAGELFKIDSEDLKTRALGLGRAVAWWQNLFAPWKYRLWKEEHLSPRLILDEKNLSDVMENTLAPFSDQPHNAEVKIAGIFPMDYEVVPERSGRLFDSGEVVKKIQDSLASFSFEPVALQPREFLPTITAQDLQPVVGSLGALFNYGDLGLNYVEPQTKIRRDWNITGQTYKDWLEARRDDKNQIYFGLKKDAVAEYLNGLRPLVDESAEDAKFTVVDGKVKEFQASQSGLSLNTDKTYEDLDRAFVERNYRPAEAVKTIALTVDVAEPKVKMADANNLGITEIMGVGVSTFHDSHTNRIKNIAHAVARLNGTLIAPDEEFSALKYAGPFTSENGFLPEEVIKGTEIKKEIGGGMCQIGTTLFRMAMNSGMSITERRNHSLVVGYYADPVNGNPGTDATLYEPILDFKFLNDTGGYLLLQTDIDYVKQRLAFTLWGKPDGRKGWYNHPIVSKWISAGDQKEDVITDTLAPGVKKCQNAFRGAVASFTYSRITPAGEKIDRVFESYYRPLPKMCMVGASSTPAAAPGPSETPGPSTSTAPEEPLIE